MTTIEQTSVNQLKINQAVMSNDIKNLTESVSEVKDDIKAIRILIEAQNTTGDKRYAAKWVQSAVTLVVSVMAVSIITALLALVIIPAVKTTTTQSTTTTTQTK